MGRTSHAFRARQGYRRAIGGQYGQGAPGRRGDSGVGNAARRSPGALDDDHVTAVHLAEQGPGRIEYRAPSLGDAGMVGVEPEVTVSAFGEDGAGPLPSDRN